MAASVQTVRQFANETGLSVTKVKEFIRQGFIPEVPRVNEVSIQLVNTALFDELARNNLLQIPLSERSVKS